MLRHVEASSGGSVYNFHMAGAMDLRNDRPESPLPPEYHAVPRNLKTIRRLPDGDVPRMAARTTAPEPAPPA